VAKCTSQFMGRRLRSSAKPECISAQTERARARVARSSGQRDFSGKLSATYSQMDRVSQTTTSPSTSTGTSPAGEWRLTRAAKSGALKLSFSSSKGIPACRRSSQGRSDQDE
jgi:hypothetical protein